jgi:phage gp36-like protein
MYKIKDLKIEIGTTFKKDVKADKKAKIESLVSELESFINKTIRDYDEAVDNEIARVLTTTAAAADGLVTEKADALEAYGKAKKQAIKALIALIDVKMDELADAAQEKNDAATEVHTYLTENYTRYLNELLEHIFEGSAEADRDVLIARALDPDVQKDFLDEVLRFNKELMEAMAKKLAIIKKELNNVKGGTDLKHKHTSDGRVAKDKNGEDVVTQEP